jgi:hypothetical protein
MADNQQNKSEEQDLKEREYRDADGNIHHHTHGYMDQHGGGKGQSGKKGGETRSQGGKGDQGGQGGQDKGSQQGSKTSHEKHVEAGRKGGEH